MTTPVLEFAAFRLAEGATQAALLAASDALQGELSRAFPGFLSRDLIHDGSGGYADVVWWANRADADAAMKAVMENKVALAYFALMAVDGTEVRHFVPLARY